MSIRIAHSTIVTPILRASSLISLSLVSSDKRATARRCSSLVMPRLSKTGAICSRDGSQESRTRSNAPSGVFMELIVAPDCVGWNREDRMRRLGLDPLRLCVYRRSAGSVRRCDQYQPNSELTQLGGRAIHAIRRRSSWWRARKRSRRGRSAGPSTVCPRAVRCLPRRRSSLW